MKKILPIGLLSVTLFFAACKQTPTKDMEVKQSMTPIDTTTMPVSNASADISKSQPGEKIKERIVYVDRPAPKPSKAITPSPEVKQPDKVTAPVAVQPKKDSAVTAGTQTSSGAGNGTVGSGTGTTNMPGSQTTTNAPLPQVKKKTGWSDGAKGAVIGGVGGAVAGAVLSKHKGKGALIGGVVGALGGLIIGKDMDKRASQPKNPYLVTNNGY